MNKRKWGDITILVLGGDYGGQQLEKATRQNSALSSPSIGEGVNVCA